MTKFIHPLSKTPIDCAFRQAVELSSAKIIINQKTKNGTDYSSVKDDPDLELAILAVLNFLETVATKISNGSLDDATVKSHLKEVVRKQVEVHLLGQCPTGVEKGSTKLFSQSDFSKLFSCYHRWE